MNNRGPQQRRPYDPWDPPSPPSDEYEDYTNPMGGWGWDGTEQMPEIVEAVLDGKSFQHKKNMVKLIAFGEKYS